MKKTMKGNRIAVQSGTFAFDTAMQCSCAGAGTQSVSSFLPKVGFSAPSLEANPHIFAGSCLS